MRFRHVVSVSVCAALGLLAGCGGDVDETTSSGDGTAAASTAAGSAESSAATGTAATGAAASPASSTSEVGTGSSDVVATGGSGAAPQPATGDPIKLGLAVAQTGGGAAALGQDQVIGAEIAAEYFNRHGGVNGRPIELVVQDTLVDEAGAINAFNNLLAEDGLVGIIGPTLSQQALAADPIADKAGVPVVAPSNTAKGIPDIGEFVARVSSPVSKMAPNAIEAAVAADPAIARAVVAYAQNDAFATSETGVFQDSVKAKGIELVEPVITFQTTDTDFTTQVEAILAADPDLVVVSGLATDGGNLVRQLRETGFEGTIVAGNGMNTRNVFKVCQLSCDGLIIAQAYSYSQSSPINDEFRELYIATKGEEPLQLAAQAFTAVHVFVDALIRVDSADGADGGLAAMAIDELRTELNAAILAGSYDTVIGPISFEPNGEIIQEKFYVARIAMTSADVGDFEYVS